jgi:hypothetical protein
MGRSAKLWLSVYWLRCLLSTYDEALGRVAGSPPANDSSHPSGINDRLQRAESIFRRHQKLGAGEYADLAGLGRTQAVADLSSLVESGLLEKIGGGRSTVYRIKGDTRKSPETEITPHRGWS